MSRLPPTPAQTPLQRYVKPVAALARVLATEDGPPTLDLLVEVSTAGSRDDPILIEGECRSTGQEFTGERYHQRRLEETRYERCRYPWLGIPS